MVVTATAVGGGGWVVAVVVVVAAAARGLRGQMMRVTQGVRLDMRVLYSIYLVFFYTNIIMHLGQVPNQLKFQFYLEKINFQIEQQPTVLSAVVTALTLLTTRARTGCGGGVGAGAGQLRATPVCVCVCVCAHIHV